MKFIACPRAIAAAAVSLLPFFFAGFVAFQHDGGAGKLPWLLNHMRF
jgi:hypothetical protein